MRQSALALEGPPEKRFRGRDIPLGAEQEIDSLSFFVDRAVKISPAPLDLHVGFIDSPGGTLSAREAVPAPFEVRNIALDPAHYRRMGQRNPAFDHHFHEIAKAELEPKIPSDTEDDDVSAFGFAPSKGVFAPNMPSFCRLHQNPESFFHPTFSSDLGRAYSLSPCPRVPRRQECRLRVILDEAPGRLGFV